MLWINIRLSFDASRRRLVNRSVFGVPTVSGAGHLDFRYNFWYSIETMER
jgi:hypothetical protein